MQEIFQAGCLRNGEGGVLLPSDAPLERSRSRRGNIFPYVMHVISVLSRNHAYYLGCGENRLYSYLLLPTRRGGTQEETTTVARRKGRPLCLFPRLLYLRGQQPRTAKRPLLSKTKQRDVRAHILRTNLKTANMASSPEIACTRLSPRAHGV